MIPRILDLSKYRQSFFLFGPRQAGKTFLIKNTLSPDIFIDLLKHDEYIRYTRDPGLLSKEIIALKKEEALIVVDEIQRCPELLNEIHLLIENHSGIQFILTGSSARKLRRGGVNLLGGRALVLHLHPFTGEELKESFSLDDALIFGALPKIALEKDEANKIRLLKSYVETYLKEEVQQEALTRNIPAFARFLELAAYENGNLLNFQALSREVGVHSKTIKEYFFILEDTLLGFMLSPYMKSHRTKLVSHPKFYFFDRGVVSALRHDLSQKFVSGTYPYGRAFEHWALLETRRYLDYYEIDAKMNFFRTSDGAEVDLILDFSKEVWAIEIKSSTQPGLSEVRGLKSFAKDHLPSRALCVCQTPRPYISGNIEFLPWKSFFQLLKGSSGK